MPDSLQDQDESSNTNIIAYVNCTELTEFADYTKSEYNFKTLE